jgi:hypothetical protein
MKITKEMKRLNKLVADRKAQQSVLDFFDRMVTHNPQYPSGYDDDQTLFEQVPQIGVSFYSKTFYNGQRSGTSAFARQFATPDEAHKFRLGFAVYLADYYSDTIRSYAKVADKFIADNKLKLFEPVDIGPNPNLALLGDNVVPPLLAKLEAKLAAIDASVADPIFHQQWTYANLRRQIQWFKEKPTNHTFKRAQDALDAYKIPVGNEHIFSRAQNGESLSIRAADTLSDEQLASIWTRQHNKFIVVNNKRIRSKEGLEAAKREVTELVAA